MAKKRFGENEEDIVEAMARVLDNESYDIYEDTECCGISIDVEWQYCPMCGEKVTHISENTTQYLLAAYNAAKKVDDTVK